MAKFFPFPRWTFWVIGSVGVLVAVFALATFFIDPFLRTEMERRLNANLDGYTASLASADFHPVGLALTLNGLTIRQQNHPLPAVLEIPRFEASVQWRELLHWRLVADMRLIEPRLHVDHTQYESESKDAVPIEDKGWQQALESIYPLKINELRIEQGDLTYVDNQNEPPIHLTQVDIVAHNIRNVRNATAAYPSEISARAKVFETGSLTIDGKADFLREPYAGVDAEVRLIEIPLEKLQPVTNDANLWIGGGVLDAHGRIEYAPETKLVHLKQAVVRQVNVDYVHSPKTLHAEAERVQEALATVEELTSAPATTLLIDDLRIENSRFAYVDETTDPHYQLLLTDTDVALKNFSNQPAAPDSVVTLDGRFMGVGKTTVRATFQPMAKTAELDFDLAVEPTPLTAMNDLLLAVGNFDVVAGSFSFYTKLSLHNGEIEGWVKPLFHDMNVYSSKQDATKGALQQLYESAVEGVKLIFENREGTVATETSVSGKIEDPQASTWRILINLATNAFVKTIVPGFESYLGRKAETKS